MEKAKPVLTSHPSNPQNPTGAILPKSLLHSLADYAESKSLPIMSDEVYRPLFHSISPLDSDFPPSILSTGKSHHIPQHPPFPNSSSRLRQHPRHRLPQQSLLARRPARRLDREPQPGLHRDDRQSPRLHDHLRQPAGPERRGLCAQPRHHPRAAGAQHPARESQPRALGAVCHQAR